MSAPSSGAGLGKCAPSRMLRTMQSGSRQREKSHMSGSLARKRVVVTDAAAFMGPDIMAAFTEAGMDAIADRRDLTATTAAEDLIKEAGRVDVLIANLTFSYPGGLAHEIDDDEMTRTFDCLVFPLHRLVRSVLP